MVGLLKIAFETGPSISIYEIWHYTYVGALPIPKHYPCHSITILEHYPYRSITITGHNPYRSITHTGALLPMPEHYPYRGTTHARASQCRSIPMLEHTHVRAYQCWSIPMSEHTNIGAYKRAMLFNTTTSCFHSFWDRANHTITKIAIYSHIAIHTQWVLSKDCPGLEK